MWHVLERSNLDKQIKELKRLLKPSGTLIVAVPNFKSSIKHGTFGQLMTCRSIFGFFKSDKILLKRNIIRVLPMKFDSFM
jgi:hypothetical protein